MRVLCLSIMITGCASAVPSDRELTRDARVESDAREQFNDAPTASDASPSPDAATQGDAALDAAVACATPISGVLATWSFSLESGAQVSTMPMLVATGVVAGNVSRAPVLTAVAGASSINSSGWATGVLDSTRYYTLSIAPPSGCRLDLTTLAIDAKASGSGPTSSAAATSADNFAQKVVVATTTPSTVALGVINAGGPVEIRVYGFAATSGSGTLRLQNSLSISGAVH